jgi:hypothetical protein
MENKMQEVLKENTWQFVRKQLKHCCYYLRCCVAAKTAQAHSTSHSIRPIWNKEICLYIYTYTYTCVCGRAFVFVCVCVWCVVWCAGCVVCSVHVCGVCMWCVVCGVCVRACVREWKQRVRRKTRMTLSCKTVISKCLYSPQHPIT